MRANNAILVRCLVEGEGDGEGEGQGAGGVKLHEFIIMICRRGRITPSPVCFRRGHEDLLIYIIS